MRVPPAVSVGSLRHALACAPRIGKSWSSRIVTLSNLPTSGASNIVLITLYTGENRSTRPTWLITPDALIAAATADASAAVSASGFSQKICLPASAAAIQTLRCIAVGVQIHTASIDGSEII